MSTPAQSRLNSGYSKPTSSQHYPPSNRHGHRGRNPGGSTMRRENIPPLRQDNDSSLGQEVIPPASYENFCAVPPPWLDSYLRNFKTILISEITDNIMKALDASYKNDVDKRRFKSSYFALKKRLTTLEAQRNGEDSQQQKSEIQFTTSNVDNGGNKTVEKKPLEKYRRPRNGRNGNHNKRYNEPISNPTNVTSQGLSSSILEFDKGHQKECIEEPSLEHDEGKVSGPTQIAEKITLPNESVNNEKNIVIAIVEKEQDNVIFSSRPTITCDEVIGKAAITESTRPLEEIFKLLVDDKSDEQSSTTTDQSAVEDVEIDKNLCKKVGSMLNKLTSENFDVLSKQVKDLEMNTLEKQQEVINVFVERASNETMYSVVYAQMCKKFAVEHECIATFREILITRCDLVLTHHKEKETMRITKMKELDKCDDEEKAKEIGAELDQKKSNEFIGALLFMGELYNQDLLTDTVIEKCLQCLLQNGTEIELEYLCHILQLIGKNLITRERSIAPYMNYLVELRESGKIGASLTILINSVVELMANSWEPLIPDISSETTEFEDAADE